MKHPAIWPNILTAFALSCGLFVIFKMNMVMPGTSNYENVKVSVSILMLAAFFDLLDGAVARVMKVESEFGGVFDSLADAVSFGVAPSVVILKALSIEQQGLIYFFLMTGAIIYSISGVLRLVRYTVQSHQNQGDQEKMALSKANFTGLPIPAAAAISTSTTLFLMSEDCHNLYAFSDQQRAIIAICVFFVIGYFMISRWKFPSLKSLHIRVGSFQVVLITAFAAALILIGLVHHFSLLLFSISWIYLLFSWILSLVRIISGRRLKTLEDFEPESKDEN